MNEELRIKGDMAALEILHGLSEKFAEDLSDDGRIAFYTITGANSYLFERLAETRCGLGCEHTPEQHKAFDQGLIAGRRNIDVNECPYEDFDLSDAWLSGHSVGFLDCRSETDL